MKRSEYLLKQNFNKNSPVATVKTAGTKRSQYLLKTQLPEKTEKLKLSDGTTVELPKSQFKNYVQAAAADYAAKNKKYGMVPTAAQSFLETRQKTTTVPTVGVQIETEKPIKTRAELDAEVARLRREEAELERRYPAGYFEDYGAAFAKENEAYARGIAETLREAPYERQAGNIPDTTGYTNIGAQESFKKLGESVAAQKESIAERIKALGYEGTKYNSDFEEKSKYNPIPKGEAIFSEDKVNGGKYYVYSGYGRDDGMESEDNRYEYINGNEDVRGIMGLYFQTNGTTLTGQTWDYLKQMNEDEVKTYNYLYSKDKKEATEYIEALKPELLKRERYERELKASIEASEHPIMSSIGTVITSPFKGLAFVGQTFDRMEGKELDPNASYNRLIHTENAMRGQVSSDIERNLGGAWGKVGSFMYQTGMSMADSGIALAASGGNGTVSAGIMSAGAAATATVNALDRGLTTEQAYSLGVIAGFAEFVSEKIGFEALLDKAALKKGVGGYVLKNMFAEGGEEGASSLVNTFADILISQDKSEWKKSVDAYIKEGKSEDEAFGLAFAKQAASFGLDVLGGMISGAGMSAGPAVVSTALDSQAASIGKDYSQVADAVIKQGLLADENSEARKIAEELQKKLEAGEKITDAELGRAVSANEKSTGRAFEAPEAGVELRGMQRIELPAKPGFRPTEFSKPISNKTIRALDAIGKNLGVEISIGAPTGNSLSAENGHYENGRIVIAQDAENPLEVVLCHEVTHHMKMTAPAEYNAFVEMAIEASEKLSGVEKTELINRYRQAYSKGTGEAFSDTQALNEITADYASRLVNDISLFNDLVKSDRNVAQRFIDSVKEFLAKVRETFSGDKSKADTASMEKYGTTVEGLEAAVAQFEKMLATTEAAVANGNINTAGNSAGGVMYDLKSKGQTKKKYANLVQSIGEKNINDFSHADTLKTEVYARRYNEEMGVKSPFFRAWFGDWRVNDQMPVKVVTKKESSRKTLKNEDTGWNVQVSGKVFAETNHMSARVQAARPYLDYINGIVESAVLLDTSTISEREAKSENSALMHSLYAICDKGDGPALLKLYVEELDDVNSDNTIKRAYQLQNLEVIKNQQSAVRSSGGNLPSSIRPTADIKTISDLFDVVKSVDVNFRPKDASVVVNKDGTPKVVYHGTNEKFTVFDLSKSGKNYPGTSDGFFFFTSEKNGIDSAEDYASHTTKRNGGEPRVVEAYLDIKKPFRIDATGAYNTVAYFDAHADEIYNEYLMGDYDGVIIEDLSKENDDAVLYLVDNPTQIKSATENVGTFDKTNTDINYSLKTEDLLSPEYGKSKASQMQNDTSSVSRSSTPSPQGEGLAEELEEESYIDDTGLDSYFDDLTKRANVISDERMRDAEKALMVKPPKREQTFQEKLAEAESHVMRKMVNSGYAIRKIADMTNDAHIYGTYNMARSSQNIASDMVHNKQTDILGRKVGDSLEAIIAPIKEKGDDYYRDFQLYLFHKHNVARMSLKNSEAELAAQEAYDEFVKENPSFTRMSEESLERMRLKEDDRGLRARKYIELRDNLKAAQGENKPIFFEEEAIPMSAEKSRARAEELLRKNPDFIADEAKVRKYIDNLMDYRIDSGLITQEEADYFRTKYPDYVPTYRDTEGNLRWIEGKANIGKTIGKAKGSNENILPLDVSLAEMTKKVVRNGQKNIFANKLYDLYENNAKSFEKYITDEAEGKRTAEADIDELGENFAENTVSFYKDGRNIELTVTPELFEAFDTLSRKADENPAWLKVWKKAFEVRKKLVTTYDPTFGIRNGFKDLQDALLNSTDARGLLKNLPKAYKEIATGGEMWELYRAAGGLYSSRFEEMQNEGVKFKSKKAKVAEKLTFANMMIEQAPRLAEFITVYEKGDANNPDTLSDALLAAAEVTTNFGESGTVGKVLNAYLVPFLNPGIQGTAKIARTFSGKKTAAQWGKLAAKTALLGLNAAFFNELITALFAGDDEEEYLKNVDDRIKDNYYLIPTGDGKFIKLPKGRVVASLGIVNERLRDVIKGEKVDVGEALSRIADNTLPTNPLKENFFTPWFEADLFDEDSRGETWYGTDIESESMQSLPVEERYDSSTDYVSRAIGKALKVSPKKANYIIEQYTGGAGRIVMPMITPSEQKGDNVAETIGLGAWSSIASNFSVDAKLSNKVSGEFYDAVTEAEQAKNSKDGTLVDAVVYKHLNRERNQMSSYNSQIRKAESDKNLSSSERRAAVRVATAARTTYQETVMDNLPEYRENVEKYLKKYPGKDEDKKVDYAYREANREMYGAEYALRVNGGKDVYAKAEEKVKRGKTTWDKYYDEYFGRDERRYDKISARFGVSYAEYEKIAQAISKNSSEKDELAAIRKLGYKYGEARVIRSLYNETK